MPNAANDLVRLLCQANNFVGGWSLPLTHTKQGSAKAYARIETPTTLTE